MNTACFITCAGTTVGIRFPCPLISSQGFMKKNNSKYANEAIRREELSAETTVTH